MYTYICVCVCVCVSVSVYICDICVYIPFRHSNHLCYHFVQLVLRAIFCTTFPISPFVQRSDFTSVITFVSHHTYFNQNFAQV